MKLSELVDYLNQLDSLEIQQFHADARESLERSMHTITKHPAVHWPKLYKAANENLTQLDRVYTDFTHNVNVLRNHARNLIAEQESEYYRESTRLWQHEMVHDSNKWQLERRLASTERAHGEILGRVLRWSDWQFPGMIIGPKLETWIDNLVALDPLYLVDTHLDLLQPAQLRYHPLYQQRLRLYQVSERSNQQILSALPANQFSLVFAYNFFNYRPFEVICKWASEIFNMLRPGGTFFFTFNDCDWSHGVALFESRYMCYTPGARLEQHLRQTGFDIVSRGRSEADVSWLEAQRPGKLCTMRAGQNLAKIVAKSK